MPSARARPPLLQSDHTWLVPGRPLQQLTLNGRRRPSIPSTLSAPWLRPSRPVLLGSKLRAKRGGRHMLLLKLSRRVAQSKEELCFSCRDPSRPACKFVYRPGDWRPGGGRVMLGHHWTPGGASRRGGGGGGTHLWSPTLPEVPCPHHALRCQGPHCRVLTVGGCGGLAWPGPALWGRRASHMMRTVGPASSPVWTGGRVWENRALSLPPVLRWRGVRVAPGFPSFVPPDLESILAASRRSRSEGRWVSPPETHPPSLRPLWAVVSRGRPRSCSELAGPSSGLAPGGFAES